MPHFFAISNTVLILSQLYHIKRLFLELITILNGLLFLLSIYAAKEHL